MKNSKRGFVPIIILIIIVAAAVGGGAYLYYSNNPLLNKTKSLCESGDYIAVSISKSKNVLKVVSTVPGAGTSIMSSSGEVLEKYGVFPGAEKISDEIDQKYGKDWEVVCSNTNNSQKTPNTEVKIDTQATTTVQTAGWKTYTNTTIGFSFKYPSDWYVDDNLTLTKCCLNITSYNTGADRLFTGQTKIQVQRYTKPASQSLMALASSPNELTGKSPKVEVVTIAGLQGVKNNSDGDDIYYLPKSETEGIRIISWSHPDTKQASQALTKQILSTFKFTATNVVSLPTTCTNQPEGTPVITSLSSYSGPVGTKLEIKGCNFLGFEGDRNIWVENDKGVKGIAYGEVDSTNSLLKVFLKSPLCQTDESYRGLPCASYLNLIPGTYKIYTMPWGKKSNEATFIVKWF